MIAGSSKPLRTKVLEKALPVPETGCWLWEGAYDRDGYGRIAGTSHGKRWFKFAHRASWEVHHGTIPTGLHVLHRCDVPACVNPSHLYLGTPKENGEDKARRGRGRSNPAAIRMANLANPQPKDPVTGRFVGREK